MKNYNLGILLILALIATVYSCTRPNGQSGVDYSDWPASTPIVIPDRTAAPTSSKSATATAMPTNTKAVTPTHTATRPPTATSSPTATHTNTPTMTATPTHTMVPTETPTNEPEIIVVCESDGTETVLVPTLSAVPVVAPPANQSQPEQPIEASADSGYPEPYPQPEPSPTLDLGDPDEVPERPPAATPTAGSP
ncbi:MAG: hypothetical protein AAF485_22360 [Chloroflexota bacterium]